MVHVPGEGLVPKPEDETQADAARGRGEGSATGSCGQQELSPREQVEAGDISASAASAAAATATTAAAATVSAAHAEAYERLGGRLLLRLRDLGVDCRKTHDRCRSHCCINCIDIVLCSFVLDLRVPSYI